MKADSDYKLEKPTVKEIVLLNEFPWQMCSTDDLRAWSLMRFNDRLLLGVGIGIGDKRLRYPTN